MTDEEKTTTDADVEEGQMLDDDKPADATDSEPVEETDEEDDDAAAVEPGA